MCLLKFSELSIVTPKSSKWSTMGIRNLHIAERLAYVLEDLLASASKCFTCLSTQSLSFFVILEKNCNHVGKKI